MARNITRLATLYADHLIVAADQSGKRIAVLVDADQPGVSIYDD
ncbi:hypothetical protein [Bradyrhizobium sp. 139]|nr:hypothetical protein [Bradyrhizobium sp. 139]